MFSVGTQKATAQPSQSRHYPNYIDTPAKQAFYDALDEEAAKRDWPPATARSAIALDAAIRATKKDNWRATKIKTREVRNTMKKILADRDEATIDRILGIAIEQSEY